VSEGRRPQSGRPTGNTGEDDMPLITPAADAYHAIAAVTSRPGRRVQEPRAHTVRVGDEYVLGLLEVSCPSTR
jgi:hypothetical protein